MASKFVGREASALAFAVSAALDVFLIHLGDVPLCLVLPAVCGTSESADLLLMSLLRLLFYS